MGVSGSAGRSAHPPHRGPSRPVPPASGRSGRLYRLQDGQTPGFGIERPPIHQVRRGVRVVESARLESVYTAKPYRGFESLPLRHLKTGFYDS